jgi:hypothetical protein
MVIKAALAQAIAIAALVVIALHGCGDDQFDESFLAKEYQCVIQ